MQIKKTISWPEKLVIQLLVLSPVLNTYGNNGWSYAAILTLVMGIVCCIFNKKCRLSNLPKGLVIYFLYWGVSIGFSLQMFPIFVIQVLISYLLFYSTFNLEYYIVVYKRIAFLFIIFFFFQYFSYLTTGIHVIGIIPGLPLNIDDVEAFYRVMERSNRCYSVFSEPAHFVQFLLPLLIIELFYDKNKFNLHYAGIIIVVLLLLQSGTAIFCLVPIVLFQYPFLKKKIMNNKRLLFPIFLLVLTAIIGGYYYVKSDMGTALGERSSEISLQYSAGENISGFLRLWRGYYVYADYNVLEKIFGNTDPAELNAHINHSGMSMGLLNEAYFNAFQNIILRTGIVGLLIIVSVFVKLYKNNNLCGKCMIMVLVQLMFLSSIYFSITMLTFIIVADYMKRTNIKKLKSNV